MSVRLTAFVTVSRLAGKSSDDDVSKLVSKFTVSACHKILSLTGVSSMRSASAYSNRSFSVPQHSGNQHRRSAAANFRVGRQSVHTSTGTQLLVMISSPLHCARR